MADETRQKKLPVIGITMGDAAGIGPEVIVKALSDRAIQNELRTVVVGDRKVLLKTLASLGLEIEVIEFEPKNSVGHGSIEVFDLDNLRDTFEIGRSTAVTGKASAEYIAKAVELWKVGVIDAICTAPLNKESLSLGGYKFPGHTEFLAELTGTAEFAMSFFAEKLRVVLLSTHLPLAKAIRIVKRPAIENLIRFSDRHLSNLLDRRVRIAVAGLNPHASEHGMFGNEERDEIEPAIAACVDEGIQVSGPYSPDTIFLRGFNGEFDAVIALYHDQATIPVKALSFGSAVNVTLGLPVIRTSVDHGTAFDISGKNIADESSMKAAIELAAELAERLI